jgi:small-conductance mechanosensitive channel
MDLQEFLEQRFFGNELQDWLLSLMVVSTVMLVFPLLRAWLRRNRPLLLARDNPVAELISVLIDRTRPIARLIVALYLGQKLLQLPPKVNSVFDFVIIIGACFQVAVWAAATLRFFVERRQAANVDGDSHLDPSPGVNVVLFIGQAVIWAIVAVVALSNLGVNITGLVAGLGIGGIAVALAVQSVLGDLLSSLSIAFDKPFAVNDLLRIDNIEGRVEHVGIRSTRLRSINGEQVVISNGDILKSRIHNLGRMTEKRVLAPLYIQYEATPDQIDQVSRLVEEAVRAQPDTRFVSCLLGQLGAYALEFNANYFVAFGDRAEPLRTIDAVNRGIHQRLSAAGIKLAYPAARQFNL